MMEEQREENISLGQWLKQERTQQGLGLEAIAARTNVPMRFLEAIESDCFEDLPGPPYAAGFVGKFAKELRVDEQIAVQRYKAEAKPCRSEPKYQIREPRVESDLPTRSMVLGGLIVAVTAYSVWFSLNHSNAEALAAIAVPDRALIASHMDAEPVSIMAATDLKADEETIENEDQSFTSGSAVLDTEDDTVALPLEMIDAPMVAAGSEDTQDDSDALTTGTEMDEETVDTPAVEVANNTDNDAPSNFDAANVDTTIESATAMVVEVVNDAWIHVTRGDEILYTGVMKAGRRYQPVSGEGVELTTGNAGGVVLHHGTWSSGPLGQEGRVRRSVSLDPKDWHDRFADNGHG